MAATVFWTAIGAIGFAYVGFPAMLALLARVRPRPVRKAPHCPTVSFVIAAYNEEAAIGGKIENTLALDYPSDRLEVIVVSDGSTDRTDDIVRGYGGRVRLLALGGRLGKTQGQNRAAEAAAGEILVFSDATTVYRPESVRRLMENFADPDVGCAAGWVVMGADPGAATMHEARSAYADFEQRVRRWESAIHSTLGVSGAVYAVRRALYTPLPPDVISDMCQPMKVVEQGRRAVLDDAAVAWEPGEGGTLREEFDRRVRVITRGLRGHLFMRTFLRPLRRPGFFLQAMARRPLRWAVPLLLAVAFVANLRLLDRPFYALTFAAQLALYGSAVVAWRLARRGRCPRWLFVPLYFCMLNLAPLCAVAEIVRGEKRITWDTARTGSQTAS